MAKFKKRGDFKEGPIGDNQYRNYLRNTFKPAVRVKATGDLIESQSWDEWHLDIEKRAYAEGKAQPIQDTPEERLRRRLAGAADPEHPFDRGFKIKETGEYLTRDEMKKIHGLWLDAPEFDVTPAEIEQAAAKKIKAMMGEELSPRIQKMVEDAAKGPESVLNEATIRENYGLTPEIQTGKETLEDLARIEEHQTQQFEKASKEVMDLADEGLDAFEGGRGNKWQFNLKRIGKGVVRSLAGIEGVASSIAERLDQLNPGGGYFTNPEDNLPWQ